MLIKDPKRVKLAVTKEIGVTGERVSDLVKNMGAIAGINAGGFFDPNGKGNGASPDGLTMHDGKLVPNNVGDKAVNIIGFNDQGKLVIGNMTAKQLVEKNMREVVTYVPNLIVEGKSVISGDGSWGIAPRTGIGQMANAIFSQPLWLPLKTLLNSAKKEKFRLKKKLRILLVWTLVSLLLQFGGYSLLNNQVEKVMSPVASEPITLQLKATIPGNELKNIQISYAKDYLAYSENGTLKVFNLTKGKVVFEKKSPSATDKTLGVLTFQWLPDRDILLYFYAKKNPNEVTTVKVYPPKLKIPPTVEQQAEDPNHPKIVPKEVPVEPRFEKRYGNPQITELYSLELPNSDEDTAPNDSLNTFDPPSGSEKISAGGKIEQFVVSATTNLMYLTVKNQSTQLLMNIDVMKEVSTLHKLGGELIDNIATSDRYGTLYFDSIVGTNHQVVALEGINRKIISDKVNDRILGIREGKVYIGQVKNNEFVKIKTTTDLVKLTNNPSLKTEWEGSIPFNKEVRWLIGAKGQIVIYDHKTANIVTAGKLAEVKLQGDENYISADGAELIQLTKEGTSTLVELQPLKP